MSTYYCEQCNYETDRSNNWKRHLISSKHLRCGKLKTWICDCCNMEFKQKSHFDEHVKTDSHQNKLKFKQFTFIQQVKTLMIEIKKLETQKLQLYNKRDILDEKLNPPGWLNWYNTKPTPREEQWSGMIDKLNVQINRIYEQIDNKEEILYDFVEPVMDKLRLTKKNIISPLYFASPKKCKQMLFMNWRENMNKLKEKKNIKKIVRSSNGLLYILNSKKAQ
jgi:hypothetical protein